MRANGFVLAEIRRVSNVSPPKYTVQFSRGASPAEGVALGVDVVGVDGVGGVVGVIFAGVLDGTKLVVLELPVVEVFVTIGDCDEEGISPKVVVVD
jgi:hypothetical protein